MISFAESPAPERNPRREALLIQMIVSAAVEKFRTTFSIPDESRLQCSIDTSLKVARLRWEAGDAGAVYTFEELGFPG